MTRSRCAPHLSAPALLVALTLAACGRSAPSRFYTLAAIPPAEPPPAVAGTPVTLDSTHLPAVLDRPEMVRRTAPTRIEISDRDRWGAPLDEMTRRVLGENLAARLPQGRFVKPGAPKPAEPPDSLTVTIDEFEFDSSGRAVLAGDWTLLAGKPARPMLHRQEHIEVDGVGTDSDAQARAMSVALGRLADRIVGALASPDRQIGSKN
jgi:uncharacterized protein